MKVINTNQSVTVPDEVDVSVKSRVVTVKGSRGTLVKSFKHLAVDISMPDKKTVRVEKWFGKKKELAAVRTVCSHITNLINGVTKVRNVLKIIKDKQTIAAVIAKLALKCLPKYVQQLYNCIFQFLALFSARTYSFSGIS